MTRLNKGGQRGRAKLPASRAENARAAGCGVPAVCRRVGHQVRVGLVKQREHPQTAFSQGCRGDLRLTLQPRRPHPWGQHGAADARRRVQPARYSLHRRRADKQDSGKIRSNLVSANSTGPDYSRSAFGSSSAREPGRRVAAAEEAALNGLVSASSGFHAVLLQLAVWVPSHPDARGTAGGAWAHQPPAAPPGGDVEGPV